MRSLKRQLSDVIYRRLVPMLAVVKRSRKDNWERDFRPGDRLASLHRRFVLVTTRTARTTLCPTEPHLSSRTPHGVPADLSRPTSDLSRATFTQRGICWRPAG
jgi:hypothetical protein